MPPRCRLLDDILEAGQDPRLEIRRRRLGAGFARQPSRDRPPTVETILGDRPPTGETETVHGEAAGLVPTPQSCLAGARPGRRPGRLSRERATASDGLVPPPELPRRSQAWPELPRRTIVLRTRLLFLGTQLCFIL
jgi:hypothetical protein